MIKYTPKFFIRIFIIGILLTVVVFLFYFNTKPTRIYREDFKGLQSPIDGPLNANQLKISGAASDGIVTMDKDQLYFNIYLSEIFTEAVFKVTFKNGNHPQLDLKVPVDKGIGDAVGYHLEQKSIDELKQDPEWSIIQDRSMVLLQKQDAKARYDSIDQFLQNLPVTKNNRGVVAKFGGFDFHKDAKVSHTEIISFDTGLNLKNVDYIIGRYEPWKQEGEWKTNEYTIVIPEAFRKKHVEFPFFIEALGSTEGKSDITIDTIEVALKRPQISFTDKISLFFERIFSKKESSVEIK